MMTLLIIALVWVTASMAFLIALGRTAARELPRMETADATPQAAANRAA